MRHWEVLVFVGRAFSPTWCVLAQCGAWIDWRTPNRIQSRKKIEETPEKSICDKGLGEFSKPQKLVHISPQTQRQRRFVAHLFERKAGADFFHPRNR